jgi:hypothetical protein
MLAFAERMRRRWSDRRKEVAFYAGLERTFHDEVKTWERILASSEVHRQYLFEDVTKH